MADTHRTVTVERTAAGTFVARNERGGTLTMATEGESFTPTELLLAAIGGCTAIDVDILTTRRAEPTSFSLDIEADKVRDEDGNHLTGIEVTFKVTFPDGEAGDAARALLPDAVQRSHDRLCTVGRTVELPTPVTTRVIS
ncbi:MAG TPA: OsmC family protein [Motilibacteraceae bacterium]|nr:OsmC family protein [Motilibacteraceae bacterium]